MSDPLLQQPRTGNVVRLATVTDVNSAAVQQARALAPKLVRLESKLDAIESKLDRITTIMQAASAAPTQRTGP